MTTDQLDGVAFLNLLLECERAGAKALRHFQTLEPPPALAEALPALARDEARYCAGLTRQITRLGGTPSRRTGDFLETVIAAEGWPARLTCWCVANAGSPNESPSGCPMSTTTTSSPS